MAVKGVDSIFIKRILYDEWLKFSNAQDSAIASSLKPESGTLHAGGAGRRYAVKKDGVGATATMVHPDYLRYQDMKKLKHVGSAYGSPTGIKRGGGKKIHNRLIWGRMNSISFRMANDMRGEVIKSVKHAWHTTSPAQSKASVFKIELS